MLWIIGYVIGMIVTQTLLLCGGPFDMNDETEAFLSFVCTLFWPIVILVWGSVLFVKYIINAPAKYLARRFCPNKE